MARMSDSSHSDSSSSSSDDEDSGGEIDAWVACDRCSKWRRVPRALAARLNDDTPWYCENNPNKAFASCDRPQELSNEEIDAMEQSLGEAHEDAADEGAWEEERARRRRVPAVWQLIRDNVLTHRKRKVQEEDDVMICQCKPVWRGGDGCGPDCINRMLCIECVPGFCPCEEHCTNQVFTKKQYAQLEVRRAGAKGFGLWALEDIKSGQFIIEYIGEVLEEEEYLRRKDIYAEIGQRHYYFMNIGNGEVIDACRKGNRARFINHSCDPNCETQKWLAGGELAIGLFAVKDIAKGEELTFDYNFERYGDKPMRCYCGSRNCRKSIGGTQQTYDESQLVDADDVTNDFQPVMLIDSDIDWATKALLDWRVGVAWDKEKEAAILARLEKICKARNVPWQPGHFYGTLPLPSANPQETVKDMSAEADAAGGGVKGKAVKKERDQDKEDSGVGQKGAGRGKKGAAAKAQQQDGKGRKGKGAAGLKQEPAEPIIKVEDDLADVKLEDDTSTGGSGDGGSRGTTSDSKPGKGLFSRLTRGAAGTAKEEADASTADHKLSDVSTDVAMSGRGRKRSQLNIKQEPEDSSVPTYTAPAASASGAPLDAKTTALTNLVAAKNRQAAGEYGATSSAISAATQERFTSGSSARRGSYAVTGGLARGARRRSEIDRRLDSLVEKSGRLRDTSRPNIIKVLRMFNLCDIGPTRVAVPAAPEPQPQQQPQQQPQPQPLTQPQPQTEPEQHPTPSGGLQGPGVPVYENGGPAHTSSDGTHHPAASSAVGTASATQGSAAGTREDAAGPGRPGVGIGGGAAGGPGPPGSLQSKPVPRAATVITQPEGVVTARQRARMVDLSLLLDVILKTSSATVKKEFVTCGVLNQLHQAIGRNFATEYAVLLRKMLRVIESLPIKADDLYSVRSAHGTLADVIQELAGNQDYDVRTKAAALIKKYPASACTDPTLLMQHTAARRATTGFSPAYAMQGPLGLPPRGPMPGQVQGIIAQARLQRGLGLSGMPAGAMGTPAGGPGVRPGSPAITPGTTLLPGGMRHVSPMPGDGIGPGSAADAGTLSGPDSATTTPAPPGVDMPLGPAAKRRKRGFSDGPVMPGMQGEMVAQMDGPQQGWPQGQPPHGATRFMPGQPGKGYPSKPLPYSYRHGAVLPGMRPDGAPPPPPLDAEELFELLRVPEVVAKRERGDRPLVPPLKAVRPPAPADPSAPPTPAKEPGRWVPHGLSTDMETIYAIGVYDVDWPTWSSRMLPPAQNSGPASNASSSTTVERPMSPFLVGPEGPPYSPIRPESVAEEAAAIEAWQAKQREQQQQRGQYPHPGAGSGQPYRPGISGHTPGLPPPAGGYGTLRRGFGSHYGPVGGHTPLQDHGPGPSPGPGGSLAVPVMDLRATSRNTAANSFTSPPPMGGGVTGGMVTPSLTPAGVLVQDLSGAGQRRRPSWLSAELQPHQQQQGGFNGPHPQVSGGTAGSGGTAAGSGPGASGLPRVASVNQQWTGGPFPGAGGAMGGDMHDGHVPPGGPGYDEAFDASEWARPMVSEMRETWDEPDDSFEQYVAEMVRYRLGKYVTTPNHPNHVSSTDAHVLFRKIKREIVEKEREAFRVRKTQGLLKLIERRKTEERVTEFVRQSIRRFHTTQQQQQ